MPIEPIVKIDPSDMERYLLYQQFYYGGDRIYGRTKDLNEHIEGAGKTIEAFYSIITKQKKLIDNGQYLQYLEFFNGKVHKIPIEAILKKLEDTKDAVGSDLDPKIITTIIVGECLMQIHQDCFEVAINDLIDRIIEKRSLDPEKGVDLKEKIKSLYGPSNPHIGMIYSLSFMELISKKVGHQNIAEKCRQLLIKYFDLVSVALE